MQFLFNLLTSDAGGGDWKQKVLSYVLIGGVVVLFIVFMIYNRRTQKKKQQETENMLNAIQPGNKVKTIGGICGVVVEVDPEDNTFVLETGTEASGKSYLKFDKQAVYQTDAVVNPAPAQAEEKQETVEETVEEPKEEPVAETEEKAE